MSEHKCFCGAGMSVQNSKFGLVLQCDAWPACDGQRRVFGDGTTYGGVTTKADRVARIKAHAALDRIWKECHSEYAEPGKRKERELTSIARARCYCWLGTQMGLTRAECHIGLMTQDQCRKVVEVCEGVTYAQVRAWWKAEGKRIYKRLKGPNMS